MNRISLWALLLICTTLSTPAMAQSNLELRHQYVMKNLKLNKELTGKFSPVCKNYLEELKIAKSEYSKLKDKYKDAEKNGTLTNGQAEQLLNAKFEADAKELAVRKKYYEEFKKVLPLKKVYYAFDLANDKKSKVKGEKN
ncbi:MAG: hypothetical protein K2N13_05755 [Paraprevotella sp.]|nr:hypothetical protein [Paraprevotella sp.]